MALLNKVLIIGGMSRHYSSELTSHSARPRRAESAMGALRRGLREVVQWRGPGDRWILECG